jgi:hypothetical protein
MAKKDTKLQAFCAELVERLNVKEDQPETVEGLAFHHGITDGTVSVQLKVGVPGPGGDFIPHLWVVKKGRSTFELNCLINAKIENTTYVPQGSVIQAGDYILSVEADLLEGWKSPEAKPASGKKIAKLQKDLEEKVRLYPMLDDLDFMHLVESDPDAILPRRDYIVVHPTDDDAPDAEIVRWAVAKAPDEWILTSSLDSSSFHTPLFSELADEILRLTLDIVTKDRDIQVLPKQLKPKPPYSFQTKGLVIAEVSTQTSNLELIGSLSDSPTALQASFKTKFERLPQLCAFLYTAENGNIHSALKVGKTSALVFQPSDNFIWQKITFPRKFLVAPVNSRIELESLVSPLLTDDHIETELNSER